MWKEIFEFRISDVNLSKRYLQCKYHRYIGYGSKIYEISDMKKNIQVNNCPNAILRCNLIDLRSIRSEKKI